jgi:hypothetical protein
MSKHCIFRGGVSDPLPTERAAFLRQIATQDSS